MSILEWLKKHFGKKIRCQCEHNYCKHWSRSAGPYGGYVQRCTKCNKIEE